MLFAVLSGFGLALAAPWLYRLARASTGWLLALLPLGLTLYFAGFSGRVAGGTTIVAAYPWAPALGVNLSFYLDGLSLLFALLILGIGALILIYAGGYLGVHQHLGRFYAFLLLFMAAMLGLVLADNLFTLFIFWELTSISSFLLIGFSHQREESRAAATQALLVTGGGGLALLAGLIMLGMAGGSFELSTLLGRGDALQNHPLYLPILLLVLVGAFTKSAQVPFHFWLPAAMEAPTPVSAYLHSATMVKAGVYLLARVSPILGGTGAWLSIVTAVGAATMLLGGVLALYQTDLKRMLAYSTISALGMLVLLLGLGTAGALVAAVVFLLAHALYKGALFMVAGALDHETGTRDVERLGGLRRTMPITAAIAGLAAVSLAGFGPVLNFIGKELALEAVLVSADLSTILTSSVVAAGALFVAVAAIVGIRPFFGAPKEMPKEPHEAPPSMLLGPAVLAGAGLVLALLPGAIEQTIVGPATSAILGQPEIVHLALWHGFNLPLGLSVVSVIAGLGLYHAWIPLRRSTRWLERVFGWGPARWYGLALDGSYALARSLTRLLQSGYLRLYLQIIIVTAIGLVGWTLVDRGGLPTTLAWTDVRFYEVGLAVLMLLAAAMAVRAPGRLTTVAALSVVGYGVSLIYILYGAPDLAMTQILVETLTVILFVLVFYHLPRFSRLSSLATRIRDGVIALTTGGLMTLLVLAATAEPTDTTIAQYFAEQSQPLAHGRNIVNVILVDFRGFDTLGEITVLSVAAIGVYALLKLRPSKGGKA
jgi:multicomponent Na+:H+ antiporter subunit A